MPVIFKSDESVAGMPSNNTATSNASTTNTSTDNLTDDSVSAPTQFQANNDDTSDNQQTSTITAFASSDEILTDYPAMISSGVITQTDRLNKQLLQSLLMRMQSTESRQSSDDEIEETSAEWA